MSKTIAINALQPGMVILRVVEQNGPVRIRKSGLVTSDAMVTGLREMGVLEVEIDPTQTVELDAPTSVAHSTSQIAHDNASAASTSANTNFVENAGQLGQVATSAASQNPSQTQFLLQSNVSQLSGANATQQDSQLAEQFNRSLFLPTAQDIPDAWQIYSKKAAAALAIVVVGFGLGFGGALFNNDALFTHAENVAAANATRDSNSNSNRDGAQVGATSSESSGDTLNASNDLNTGQNAGLAQGLEQSVAGDANAPSTPALGAKSDAQTLNKAADTLATISEEEVPEKELLVLGMQPGDTVKLLDENGQEVGGTVLNANEPLTADDSPSSQALLAKLQKAMEEVDAQGDVSDAAIEDIAQTIAPDVPSVSQMPSWILSSLPKMSFNTHIYATEPADRWVKVNGKELGEGDWIDGQLRVERIEQQHVILNFQGHEFSMRALSEW